MFKIIMIFSFKLFIVKFNIQNERHILTETIKRKTNRYIYLNHVFRLSLVSIFFRKFDSQDDAVLVSYLSSSYKDETLLYRTSILILYTPYLILAPMNLIEKWIFIPKKNLFHFDKFNSMLYHSSRLLHQNPQRQHKFRLHSVMHASL